jgi:hypothetical protein
VQVAARLERMLENGTFLNPSRVAYFRAVLDRRAACRSAKTPLYLTLRAETPRPETWQYSNTDVQSIQQYSNTAALLLY